MSKSFYSYTNILTKNMAELVNIIKKKSKNEIKFFFFSSFFVAITRGVPGKYLNFQLYLKLSAYILPFNYKQVNKESC